MSQKFYSDIEARAGLMDSSGALGTSGQILSSTGSNVSWINQSTAANDVQNRVKAGVAINKGQAVYVTGADGTNIIVGLASNASEATSSKTLGLLNATVAINGMADVVQIGRLSGLNTLGATAGDPVWLGTGGNLIYGLIGKPYAPANLVFIGIVTRVNVSNGEIFVNVQNGFELNEIHDVDLKTNVPINGDVLGFNGTLWVNKTIAGWLGYTPANASGTTNYVSKFTGATTLGNSLLFDNGTNVGIGTTSPGSKLDVSSGNINLSNSFNLTARNNANTFNIALIGRSSTDRVIIDADGYGTNIGGGGTVLINPTGGNVGIGTTSPTASAGYNTLSVNGSSGGQITLQTGNAIKGYIYNTSTSLVVGADLGNALVLDAGNTERMRITSGGNVGIGTSSPSEKLHVVGKAAIGQNTNGTAVIDAYGSIAYYGCNNANNGMGIGPTGAATFSSSVTASQFNILNSNQTISIANTSDIQINASVASSNILFRVSGDERMRITSSGNVGIGTTSPGYKLQVNDTIATVTGFGSFTALQSAAGTGFRWTLNNDGTFRVQKTADGFSTISATPIAIDSSNRVGIGTTAPQRDLQVGAFSGSPEICIGSSTAGNGTLAFGDGASGNDPWRGYVQYNHSVDAMIFGTVNGEKVRITSAGYMGIGTTAPSYPLYVGTQVSNVSIYADYDIVAFSDQSVKENIRPIENVLERVIESRGVLYDRIDSGEKDNIGFIAQELEVAFPELVVTNEDGTKAVKYQNAVAVLFEAVKEQQKQIDEIKRILNGITN